MLRDSAMPAARQGPVTFFFLALAVAGCMVYGANLFGSALRRSLCRAEIGNRLEQALAVTELYANLFEVAVRQFTQNLRWSR